MSDGYSYVNPAAFEALTLGWGDAALANEGGTSSIVSGSDSAHSAASAMHTAPETVQSNSLFWSLDQWKNYLSSGLPVFGPFIPSMPLPESMTPKGVGEGAVSRAVSGAKSSINWRNLLGSILLVLVGLIVLSRALGMMGGEKITVLAKLAGKAAK